MRMGILESLIDDTLKLIFLGKFSKENNQYVYST